jgi:hypothetical protein
MTMELFGLHWHGEIDPWEEAPPWAIELREMVSLLLQQNYFILKQERQIMFNVSDLVTEVADEKTTVDGAVVTLNGMAALIASLKTTQTDPATAAAIDKAVSDLRANRVPLAAAIIADTPAPSANAPPVTPAAATQAATAAVAAAT